MHLLLLALLMVTAPAHAADDTARKAGAQATIPTVTFSLEWQDSMPPRYSVSVDAAGSAVYEAVDKTMPQQGDIYAVRFSVSTATRGHIFEVAERLRFFQGDWDFKKHKVAYTGTKRLRYSDGDRNHETTYNWSESADITELTKLFMSIANTQNHARRLAHIRRFDKLGLDSELKSMEESARLGYLAEVQAIAPLLQDLARDHQLMKISRQRALRLLRLAEAQAPAGQGP